MNNNAKIKLFNFNKSLNYDQKDISVIIESHIEMSDKYSETEILNSLDKSLAKFEYFDNIETLLSDLRSEISTDKMYYDLKELYYKLERSNHSLIYRQPINVVLDCINTTDKTARYEKVITELALYDWVPDIKSFVFNITKKPGDKIEYSSRGGKMDSVYSVVVKNESNFLTFIKDKWFKLTENKIEPVLLENYIKDADELKRYRIIEQAIKAAVITDDKISFHLDEKFVLGLSTSKPGELFINEDKAEAGTTLEMLFSSPLVPFMAKGYFGVINETLKSIKSIVELDFTKKVTNILQPYFETYAFNYKGNFYIYRNDKRTGSNFYKYESASGLIGDVMKEIGVDLTPFYLENVSQETKKLATLANQEINLGTELARLDEALIELTVESDKYSEEEEYKKLKNTFLLKKHKILESIKAIKVERNNLLNDKNSIINENVVIPTEETRKVEIITEELDEFEKNELGDNEYPGNTEDIVSNQLLKDSEFLSIFNIEEALESENVLFYAEDEHYSMSVIVDPHTCETLEVSENQEKLKEVFGKYGLTIDEITVLTPADGIEDYLIMIKFNVAQTVTTETEPEAEPEL